MLQASPHVIHFKSILDFGEGQHQKQKEHEDLGMFTTSSVRKRTHPLWLVARFRFHAPIAGMDSQRQPLFHGNFLQ